MNRTPKYAQELYQYIESVPFGELNIQIRRVDHKTVQISTVAEETLRYVNNEEALRDLINMVQKLTQASFSGEAHIKLDLKDGQIRLIGIFDKKDTKYN